MGSCIKNTIIAIGMAEYHKKERGEPFSKFSIDRAESLGYRFQKKIKRKKREKIALDH